MRNKAASCLAIGSSQGRKLRLSVHSQLGRTCIQKRSTSRDVQLEYKEVSIVNNLKAEQLVW
jgi:hypothetical protein